jgi:3-hydroxyacyl-[acyl-carrier-protein] dehydratase
MKSISVLDYIPQRPPMVMIDELIACDEKTATSSFLIKAGNIFVEDEKFTEPGLIENIAQTAAAMMGYQCALQNAPVPIGFIAAVKDLKINFIPNTASVIETTVTVTNNVMNVSIIEGKVEQSGKILCICEMKILIQNNL